MRIKDLPQDTRPREKFLNQGGSSLDDVELLAMLLQTGTRNLSALELGQALFSRFGNWRGLIRAQLEDLTKIHGIGTVKALRIMVVMEVARRNLKQSLVLSGEPINKPEALLDFLNAHLRDKQHEIFAVIYLNAKNQMIGYEELFRGTVDRASIYPRELIKRALAHNATAVFLAHNHPSGNAKPSQEDFDCTKRIKVALEYVDVKLYDHVIIGEGQHSFLLSDPHYRPFVL